jgi:Zn-dependent protease
MSTQYAGACALEYHGAPGVQPSSPSITPVTIGERPGSALSGVHARSERRGGILAILAVAVKMSKLLFMAAAVLSYVWIFGPLFAVGIIGLIYVHEMGHVVALRRKGIPASLPILVPFLGAFVRMKAAPDNAADEAYVGIAGPVVGGCGAAVVYVVAVLSGSHFLMALAYVGFLINLFNLLPMLPLDGGRVMAAISPKVWAGGLVGLVALFAVTLSPFFAIIALLGCIEAYGRWSAHRRGGQAEYFSVPKRVRMGYAAAYFGLVIALACGMGGAYVAKSETTHSTHTVSAVWSTKARAVAQSCRANANGRNWTLSFSVPAKAPYIITSASCHYPK